MFNLETFKQHLRKANASFSNYKRSSLQNLEDLLSRGNYNSGIVQTEVDKIPLEKAKKFSAGLHILLLQIPFLSSKLRQSVR